MNDPRPESSSPTRIKIDKATDPNAWYAKHVGQTFVVERFEKNLRPDQGIPEDVFWCRTGDSFNTLNYVRASDAAVVSEPGQPRTLAPVISLRHADKVEAQPLTLRDIRELAESHGFDDSHVVAFMRDSTEVDVGGMWLINGKIVLDSLPPGGAARPTVTPETKAGIPSNPTPVSLIQFALQAQQPSTAPQLPAEVREAIRATWGVGAITEERLARALAPFFAAPQASADVEKVAEEIAGIGADDGRFIEDFKRILHRLVAAKDAELKRLRECLTAANYGDVPKGWDDAIARAERAEAKLRCADDVFTRYSFMIGANPGDELVANIVKLFAERDALRAWKDTWLRIESEWDQQAIAKLLGCPLGYSCRKWIGEKVPVLVQQLAEARNRQEQLDIRLKEGRRVRFGDGIGIYVPISELEAAEQERDKLRSYYNAIVAEIGHDGIIADYRKRGELLSQEVEARKAAQRVIEELRQSGLLRQEELAALKKDAECLDVPIDESVLLLLGFSPDGMPGPQRGLRYAATFIPRLADENENAEHVVVAVEREHYDSKSWEISVRNPVAGNHSVALDFGASTVRPLVYLLRALDSRPPQKNQSGSNSTTGTDAVPPAAPGGAS